MNALSTACRNCAAASLRPRFHAKGYTLEQCGVCDFMQIARAPSAEELSAIYADTYYMGSKYSNVAALDAENAQRNAMLRRYVSAGSTLLEAGCATGDFLRHVVHDYAVYGFDLSAFAIAQAKEKNPTITHALTVTTTEAATYDANSFDVVCMWDVIEHVWDPRATLIKLASWIRPGGYLMLSTPAADAPIARIMGKYWAFMTPPEHMGFFARKSFEALLPALDMKMVHYERRGKTTSIGFVLYKLQRIFPALVPGFIMRALVGTRLSRTMVYVPTGDIQYLVLQKAV